MDVQLYFCLKLGAKVQLHDEYLKIYTIYYSTDSRGFFAKLFKRKIKISNELQQLSKEHFEVMKAISEALIVEIDRMGRRITAVMEEEVLSL